MKWEISNCARVVVFSRRGQLRFGQAEIALSFKLYSSLLRQKYSLSGDFWQFKRDWSHAFVGISASSDLRIPARNFTVCWIRWGAVWTLRLFRSTLSSVNTWARKQHKIDMKSSPNSCRHCKARWWATARKTFENICMAAIVKYRIKSVH